MRKDLHKIAMFLLLVTSGLQIVFGQSQEQAQFLMQSKKMVLTQQKPGGDGYMDAPIVWSYAKDAELAGLGPKQTASMSAAVYIPAGAYVGDEIRYIRIGVCDPIKDVEVFIRKELDGENICTIKVGDITPAATDEYGICKAVQLNEPFKIKTDEALYLGYTGTVQAGKYSIGFANVSTASPRSCYLRVNVQGQRWEDLSSSYPPLSIEGLVWGDNIPYAVTPSLDYTKLVSSSTEPASCSLSLYNSGASTANSVDVEYTINGATKTISAQAVSVNQFNVGGIDVDFDVISKAGSYPFSLKVTKVDGQPNVYADISLEGTLFISEKTVNKVVVCEEFTGTGCGFCPLGIVGLAYMREKYPDSFLPIGVHLYNSSDPMYVKSYSRLTNYFTGAPSCIMDRNENSVGMPSLPTIEESYKIALKRSSIATISISCKDNGNDLTNLKATATVNFVLDPSAFNGKQTNYKIAFVVLEDKVDKDKKGEEIRQTNYFSDNFKDDQGTLEGWDEAAYLHPWSFDDVARGIYNYAGINNSVPAEIKANTDYTFSYDIEMPYVLNMVNVRIAALLMDSSTGMIENAAVMSLASLVADAISNVSVEKDVKVISNEGGFSVILPENEKATVALYDVSGKLLWSTESSDPEVNVPVRTSGIYIIRTIQGNSTIDKKVIK